MKSNSTLPQVARAKPARSRSSVEPSFVSPRVEEVDARLPNTLHESAPQRGSTPSSDVGSAPPCTTGARTGGAGSWPGIRFWQRRPDEGHAGGNLPSTGACERRMDSARFLAPPPADSSTSAPQQPRGILWRQPAPPFRQRFPVRALSSGRLAVRLTLQQARFGDPSGRKCSKCPPPLAEMNLSEDKTADETSISSEARLPEDSQKRQGQNRTPAGAQKF